MSRFWRRRKKWGLMGLQPSQLGVEAMGHQEMTGDAAAKLLLSLIVRLVRPAFFWTFFQFSLAKFGLFLKSFALFRACDTKFSFKIHASQFTNLPLNLKSILKKTCFCYCLWRPPGFLALEPREKPAFLFSLLLLFYHLNLQHFKIFTQNPIFPEKKIKSQWNQVKVGFNPPKSCPLAENPRWEGPRPKFLTNP